VTREEILEQIWGKGIFISENSINTAVRKIRRALNDDADAPQFIVTVPSGGYRFEALIRTASGTPIQSRMLQGAFIGRNIEMAELRAGLADAAAGLGRLFLISGQPGIGKTRMARELVATAEASGMRVLAGQCSEHDEAVPCLPFVEILEAYVECTSGPDVLRTLLGEEGPELARLLPKLNRILPDLPPPLELPPQQARRHLFNCFCDFIARVARERTTLLILEDLHWADDSTLSLLVHLTQRLSGLPMLVAGTYRDAELNVSDALAKTLENLTRDRLATVIRLTGLQREEIAQMLSGLSGQAPPAAIAAEFYRETEGNPFFIEELFRHLEEENRLYDSDGIFHAELSVAELEVPRSVRLVVGRRLARLSDRTRSTLGTAATIGRLFTFELLEASTKSDASSLLESVEEAERAGLVFSNAESPTARFEFSHELVRQAVVGGLSAARRQRLHLEVAEAVERVYSHALEDHYGELAHHYRLGDNVPKAVEYLTRSAEQGAQRGAYSEAVTQLNVGLALLEGLPEGADRARQELALHNILGRSLFGTQGSGSQLMERAYTRAHQLAVQLSDSAALLSALTGLRMCLRLKLNLEKAREMAEQMVVTARAHEPAMLAAAYAALGEICFFLGQFDRARDCYGQAAALPESNRKMHWTLGFGAAALLPYVLEHWSWASWALGSPGRALSMSRDAIALARQESQRVSRLAPLAHAGRLSQWLRDSRAAMEQSEELLALAGEYGSPFFRSLALSFRGWALAEQGQIAEGIAEMRQAITDLQNVGYRRAA
jgi:adenylate cyclase